MGRLDGGLAVRVHPGLRGDDGLEIPLPWFLRWRLPREYPIYLLVGRRGHWKSSLAASMVINRMRRGERVYSTVPIIDWERGLRSGVIWSILDCLDLRECSILIDEAGAFISSRDWDMIPAQVLARWQESRKHGIGFIFTSTHEERVDKVIRELCDWILLCERVPLIPRWVPIARFRWTFLEAINEVRRGGQSKAEYWWVPSRVLAAYDTRNVVETEVLQQAKEYMRALKEFERGKSDEHPSDRGLTLPDRVEPARFVDGEWRPWDYTRSQQEGFSDVHDEGGFVVGFDDSARSVDIMV